MSLVVGHKYYGGLHSIDLYSLTALGNSRVKILLLENVLPSSFNFLLSWYFVDESWRMNCVIVQHWFVFNRFCLILAEG